jgi:ubiquinone/menaquinone biosynthesis C-methylase UbiE
LAGLQAGDTFLDVAAGTGGLSLPAARLGAKVLATDWSPRMIEQFSARATAEGLDAEGRVMDCQALDVPDDSYDVTGSQFGVMLVPDQAQALREMVRVTKPGGHGPRALGRRRLRRAHGAAEHRGRYEAGRTISSRLGFG